MEIERHRYGSSSSSSSSAAASPKQRPRHSIGFSCCFSTSGGGEAPAPSPTQSQSQSLLRSSSTWLRARAQELPDLVGRLGRRRRFASGDFRYDPLSYALNFDEGGFDDDDEEDDGANVGLGIGSRHFSYRLPAPPPRSEIAVGVA
ncbi:uncharacterized protein LOC109704972 [Ananas comosus]|uniref:Uncharacterized protein LOC109704972 n=1 Tax=Ananas comosus TaxID=4615 RepID=A0A6P5ED84_ANACO|nr:uncharacterized protein LOC109704972 [Ananas comosus]